MEKKLALSKETLRTLDDAELTAVVGGQPTTAGVVCVDSVICDSGVCASVVCDSAVCGSVVCDSIVCESGILCNVG